MTGQLSRSMQMHANTDKLRGSINAVPATITSESDTERRLAGGAASTATSVMSRSRSHETEVSNRSVPSRAFTRHHGKYSVMGTIFNPAVREATSSLPCTIHTSEDRTDTPVVYY